MADISGVSESDVRDIYDRISRTGANILVSRKRERMRMKDIFY